MSHDRSNMPLSDATPTHKLHSGFFESVVYTAFLLTAVIVLAPLVMLFPKRK